MAMYGHEEPRPKNLSKCDPVSPRNLCISSTEEESNDNFSEYISLVESVQRFYRMSMTYEPKNFKRQILHFKEPIRRIAKVKGVDLVYLRTPPITYSQLYNAISESLGKIWKHDEVPVVTTSNVHCLQLETTYETRNEEIKQQPYKGNCGNIVINNKKYNSKWDYKPDYGKGCQTVILRIPNTTSVISCNRCYGKGRSGCDECCGSGTQYCSDCYGGDGDCEECGGGGTVVCGDCGGNTMADCEECEGEGSIETFTQLVMTKKLKCDSKYFNNIYEMSSYSLQQCQGYSVKISKTKSKLLSPLTSIDCLNMDVVDASHDLLHRHKQFNSENSQILNQKYRLSIIPVHEVFYLRKRKQKLLYIAGTNLKVIKMKSTKFRQDSYLV